MNDERTGADSSDAAPHNPFGVMDAPEPDSREVREFAAQTTFEVADDDANASPWSPPMTARSDGSLEGSWSSRWNGFADPTMDADTPETWKQGQGELRSDEDRVYLLFDWDEGRRRGLIEARRSGSRDLQGQYVNLSDPTIAAPWAGRIVDDHRIDGFFPGGRLDFRR